MVVPFLASPNPTSNIFPPLITTWVPISPMHVFKSTLLTAAMEAKASPLKPKVVNLYKSSSSSILLVACLEKAKTASSLSIPLPLSMTFICLVPASSNSTLISVLPASILFSTNSLTTEAHLSTTSPAAILLARSSSIIFITAILSPFV